MKISFDPMNSSLTELTFLRSVITSLINGFENAEPTGAQVAATCGVATTDVGSFEGDVTAEEYTSNDDIPEFETGNIVLGGKVVQLTPPVVSPPASPPVTVTPPPAPNTQEPAAVSTGEDAELDSDGIAWDPTIHSETRMKNANGTWRKRRTTKNVEVKQSIPGLEHLTPNSVPAPPERKMVNTFVRINGAQNLIKAPDGATDEELSAITGQPTVREDRYQAIQSAPVAETATVVATVAPIVPSPPPAAPPAPAVVKTAPQGAPAGTFAELMERVTKYFASQSITTQDLIEVCATFSIESVQECYAQPTLIPLVSNAIDEKVKARMSAA